ncbi:MAG: monovalent cation:proton antiporter-2 (CPA2) family protein [Pseudomonadota bacterium]
MNESSTFSDAVVFLSVTVIFVPIARKLGLGSVIGFLIGGILIGPWGAGLITDYDEIMHFSELGIVFLLFIIGLEILPKRLWEMRTHVVGLGAAQVVITSLVVMILSLLSGLSLLTASIVSLGVSLSSTAFALQLLAEKNQLSQRHGQRAFAILLFQDMAIVPILAILPVLTHSNDLEQINWVSKLLVIIGLILGGHYLLRPFFRYIASTQNQEVFMSGALLVVLGIAGLMNWVGISMALGAFIAGVLLADSEYRHELETNIEPVKGLLMGLFFISVGMSINLTILIEQWYVVSLLLMLLVSIKLVILYVIGRLSGLNSHQSRTLSIMLSQTGEFAFVLFTLGRSQGVLSPELFQLLMLVVALSMMTTPLLLMIFEKIEAKTIDEEQEAPRSSEESPDVLLIGFGRYGEIIARVLMSKKIAMTALDSDPKQIEFVKRFGAKVYYGDATRVDVLRSAGATKAKVLIVAIDNREASLKIAKTAKNYFGNLKVFARAQDRYHAYQLIDAGVDLINRETFESSLEMAKEVLMELGMPDSVISETLRIFKYQDQKLLWRAAGQTEDLSNLIQLASKKKTKKN